MTSWSTSSPGSGTCETVFGSLRVGLGDYVLLPTSTTHRWVPDAGEPLRLLVTEASGHIGPPRRYLSPRGQFLEHSPYCERDLRGPGEPLLVEGEEVEVLVRHRQGWTRFTYAHHPFDVVGWDGCLYPYVFSIHDFEPITGRLHQPPPVHQTFEGPNFVICSFVPRLFDYHPESIPAPYNHANVDSDEVIFYVGGDFMSRKGAGIELGSLTLHPSGFTHGPQPGLGRGLDRGEGDRGARGHARHVPTARPGAGLDGGRGPAYPWTWARRSGASAGETRDDLRLRLKFASDKRGLSRTMSRTPSVGRGEASRDRSNQDKGLAGTGSRVKVEVQPSDDRGGTGPPGAARPAGGDPVAGSPSAPPEGSGLSGPLGGPARRTGGGCAGGRCRHHQPGAPIRPLGGWSSGWMPYWTPDSSLASFEAQRRALR